MAQSSTGLATSNPSSLTKTPRFARSNLEEPFGPVAEAAAGRSKTTAGHCGRGKKGRMRSIRALLLGAPGAGKGTQASRLRKHHGFNILSSGDLLRSVLLANKGAEDQVHANEHLAQEIQKHINVGALVPDSLMQDLIFNAISTKLLNPNSQHLHDTNNNNNNNDNGNWALDGFPRSIKQAQMLSRFLKEKNSDLNVVFNLDVPHSVIIQRIEDRWIHASSGRTYNLSYNPPKIPGKDDITGENLTKRPDDNVDTFKKRLDTYSKQTQPLIDFYSKKGILVNFSGETSDEIWNQLEKYIKECKLQ